MTNNLLLAGWFGATLVLVDFFTLGHFAIRLRTIRLAYGARCELLYKTLPAHAAQSGAQL